MQNITQTVTSYLESAPEAEPNDHSTSVREDAHRNWSNRVERMKRERAVMQESDNLTYGRAGEDSGKVSAVALPAASLQATFSALQEWEGYVLSVEGERFTARLLDLTAESNYEEEEAEISVSELSDEDRALLEIGRIFRWVIGYERSPSGTKRRISHIVFRNLPAWTEQELRDARVWAKSTAKFFTQ